MLRGLEGARNLRNFTEAKGAVSASAAKRRLLHSSSSLVDDVRAQCGRRIAGQWLDEDWVEVRMEAGAFGAQQARRMAGVLVALVRGVEGEDYLRRCVDGRHQVATPLAPAEATWLASFSMDPPDATCYLPPSIHTTSAAAAFSRASAGEMHMHMHHGVVLNDAMLVRSDDATTASSAALASQHAAAVARVRAGIIAHVRGHWQEFVASIDAGDATRSRDDSRLRSAAAGGDARLVASSLAAGAARLESQDEYGRSPLFLAAFGGHAEVVELLLDSNAKPTRTANGGWLACAAAEAAGHASLAARLKPLSIHSGNTDGSTSALLHKALTTRGGPLGVPTCAPRLTMLLPPGQPGLAGHPGIGTLTLDGALPDVCIDALLALWRGLPVAPKDKPSPINRSYYQDVDGWLCQALNASLVAAGLLPASRSLGTGTSAAGGASQMESVLVDATQEGAAVMGTHEVGGVLAGNTAGSAEPPPLHCCGALPLVRFLHYPSAGGSLPAHVDLPRVVEGGWRTTHSFLLYLTDCEHGGETLLLEAHPGDERLASAGGVAPGERQTLAASQPRRGRLLLMPHACPHSAAPVVSAPKLLIRGEVLLPSLLQAPRARGHAKQCPH